MRFNFNYTDSYSYFRKKSVAIHEFVHGYGPTHADQCYDFETINQRGSCHLDKYNTLRSHDIQDIANTY